MVEKQQKPYPRKYNLSIAQDLWQAHSQILLAIFLKEFVKLYQCENEHNNKKWKVYGIKYKD